MRIDYKVSNIDDEQIPSKDPFKWFDIWFNEAVNHSQVTEANSMNIATSTRYVYFRYSWISLKWTRYKADISLKRTVNLDLLQSGQTFSLRCLILGRFLRKVTDVLSATIYAPDIIGYFISLPTHPLNFLIRYDACLVKTLDVVFVNHFFSSKRNCVIILMLIFINMFWLLRTINPWVIMKVAPGAKFIYHHFVSM